MQNPFSRSKCFPLIRLDLVLHIVPRIRYLGFTLKGRRVPWLRQRTCPLASPNELWYDNQPSTTSNQPCCLLQCSGTTLRVRLRRPLDFFVVLTCWEICFPSRRYSTYHFLLFLFWIIISAILPTMMLGYYSMSASFMPSEFFHHHFDLLEVCFL
jgi:hypothetical protein